MQIVHGKRVFDSLSEVVDPRHTAVLVIDMQNDLVSPDGVGGRAGGNVSAQRAIIPALQQLLDAARQACARVVYVQLVTERNYATMHPSWLYRYRVMDWVKLPLDRRLPEDGWGGEVVEEITPQPGDMVVKKHRESAFIGTELDRVLRSNGVRSRHRRRHGHRGVRPVHGPGRAMARLLRGGCEGLRAGRQEPAEPAWPRSHGRSLRHAHVGGDHRPVGGLCRLKRRRCATEAADAPRGRTYRR